MKKTLLGILTISLMLLNTSAQELSRLFEEVKSSVVVIHVLSKRSTGMGDPYQQSAVGGLGSGVLVSNDGSVLTAAHVVNEAAEIMVEFIDGSQIPARVERIANQADVALIKLNSVPSNARVARIGDSDDMKVGDPVFVIGAPMGLSYSLSSGIISARHNMHKMTNRLVEAEFFQVDAAINSGNSGGPVFNMNGDVIAIASAILSRSGGFEGIGFAATTEVARTLLVKKQSYWWGFTPIFLYDEWAAIFNVPQAAGVLVGNVTDKSPAHFAGLKGGYINMMIGDQELLAGGDIILAVEDIKLDTPEGVEEANEYVNGLPEKTRFNITILRAGKVQSLGWFK